MKTAFTTDWHLRGKDLDACRAQLEALVDMCISRRVSLVAVAGDVFDRASIGDSHASTGAIAAVGIEAVKCLTDAGIEVLMIPGNHDQAGAGSADALHVFDGMERVQVVREPGIMTDSGRRVIFLCLPWSWGGENPEQILSNWHSPSGPMILLAHIQVTGARMNGSHCCEAAPGKWQISRAFLESLPVDHVALGDFHARQDLTGGRGGYIGALRQCNFGEQLNPAGFEIYDSETHQTEWIELNAAPRYWTYNVTENGMGGPAETMPDDKIRYVFDGITPDPVEVRKLEAAGVQVEQTLDREERIRRADVPTGILSDPHSMLRLFAATQTPEWPESRTSGALAQLDKLRADKGAGEAAPVAVTTVEVDPF